MSKVGKGNHFVVREGRETERETQRDRVSEREDKSGSQIPQLDVANKYYLFITFIWFYSNPYIGPILFYNFCFFSLHFCFVFIVCFCVYSFSIEHHKIVDSGR